MKLKVFVKTNSKHEKIEKISETEFKIWVKSQPIEGKANEAVIEALAAYFNIPKSCISLLYGDKSKTKLLQLHLKK